MEHTNYNKVYTAIILLLITFIIKLFVGKWPSRADVEKALIELPVNLFGASISLVCAYFIASKEIITLQDETPIILCYFLGFICVVILWRGIDRIEYSGVWYKILIGFLLYLIILGAAFYALIRAINFLIPIF